MPQKKKIDFSKLSEVDVSNVKESDHMFGQAKQENLTQEEIDQQVEKMKVPDDVAELIRNAQYGKIQEVRSALKAKPELVNQGEGSRRTALHFASFFDHQEVIKVLVDEFKAEIDSTDSDYYTPLFYAVKKGHKGSVQLLLERGADVNYATSKGVTAVHQAAGSGDIEMMQFLIDHGAKVSGEGEEFGSALHWAVGENKLDVIKFLVEEIGVQPSCVDKHGGTGMFIAAASGHEAIVSYLLSKGVDPNHQANDQSTALHMAAEFEQPRIAQILANAGAQLFEDKDGDTPLVIAKRKSNSRLKYIISDIASRQRKKENHEALMKAIAEMSQEERKAKATIFKTRGNDEFKQRHYLSAIDFYSDAILHEPENPALYTNRATAYFQTFDYEAALKDANKSVELDENWAKGYYRKGICLAELGQNEEALKFLNLALEKGGDKKGIEKMISQIQAKK